MLTMTIKIYVSLVVYDKILSYHIVKIVRAKAINFDEINFEYNKQ